MRFASGINAEFDFWVCYVVYGVVEIYHIDTMSEFC